MNVSVKLFTKLNEGKSFLNIFNKIDYAVPDNLKSLAFN